MPWVDEFTDIFSDTFGRLVSSGYTNSVPPATFDPAFPPDFFPATVIVNPPPGSIQVRPRQRYALFVRDGDLVRRAQVGDYVTATLTPRWGAAGQWSATLPRASDAANQFLQPRAGIYVEHDGKPFFSGPAMSRELSRDANRSQLIVSGTDDTGLVSRRLAMTEPNLDRPPYVTMDHDTHIGPTSSVIWQFINVNIGPSAVAQRRYPGLVMATDPALGTVVTGQGKFQQLDTLIEQLGQASKPEIGWSALQQGNTIVLTVAAAVDRTSTAVFSVELGNINSYTYTDTAGANYAVGGGAGTSIDRVIVEQADSNAMVEWGRIESFNDHSDQTTLEGMNTLLAADLAVSADTTAVSFVLADSGNLRFGQDFFLGDLVQVLIEGQPIVQIVREATIVLATDTAVVTPIVSSPGPSPTQVRTHLIAAIRALRKQLRDLQRNK